MSEHYTENSIPNHLVPLKDISRKESWKLLMMEHKLSDLLLCPINEATFRNLSDISTVPSSVKKAANVFFYTVTGALTSPYTVIHRFFVAGDYGRKTAVGEFDDLRLVAYVSESPPYDVPASTSQSALNQNIHDVLCEHFSHLKRAGNFSESFNVSMKKVGDVLVHTSRGQQMTIRLAPACSNPCVKASDDAGGGFDDVRAVLHNMLRDDWRKSSDEKDRHTYCYFEEVASRVLSSLPDQWIRFIRLVKYIFLVHAIPLENEFVETLAVRVLVATSAKDTWPHTKCSPKILFESCLLGLLDAVIDKEQINRLDQEEYPKNLCHYVHKTDKISLQNEELDEILCNLSDIHVNESQKFFKNRNELGITLRPLFRPFYNLADSVSLKDWEEVQFKCTILFNIVSNDKIDDLSMEYLFRPISRESFNMDSGLVGKEMTTPPSKSIFLRYMISFLLSFLFYCMCMVIIFGFISFGVLLVILEEDGRMDLIKFEMWRQQLQIRLVQSQSNYIMNNNYVNLFFKNRIVGFIEDQVENLIIDIRHLPKIVNSNLTEQHIRFIQKSRLFIMTSKYQTLNTLRYLKSSLTNYTESIH